MRTLYDENFANLDISTEQELARFTVTDQHAALIIMINVDDLSGAGGEYSARVWIDDRIVVPDRKVIVDVGRTAVSFQSRDIVLYIDGILKVYLQGTASDTNVSGRLIIIDTSPVTVEEISDLIDGMTPDIISSIEQSIKNLDVTVKPETKVFGPCQKPITSVPQAYKKSVVPIPKIKRC